MTSHFYSFIHCQIFDQVMCGEYDCYGSGKKQTNETKKIKNTGKLQFLVKRHEETVMTV